MKKAIITIALAISSILLSAQYNRWSMEDRPMNNINLNLLGDASLIALNYERLFFINDHFFLAGKIGMGYNETFNILCWGGCYTERYFTIPHSITGNLGGGRHFFEFGLGGTFLNGSNWDFYRLYPILGYRLQPLQYKRVNFRIFGTAPFSGWDNINDIFFSPVGLSLGLSL